MQRLKQNVDLDLQAMGLKSVDESADEPPEEEDPFDRAMSDRIDRVVAEAVMKAKSSRRGGEEATPQPPDPAVEALVSDTLKLVEKEAKPSSPFRSRDFVKLFLTATSTIQLYVASAMRRRHWPQTQRRTCHAGTSCTQTCH